MILRKKAMARRSAKATAYAVQLKAVTPQVLDRADYRCELKIPFDCGRMGSALQIHHRQLRSQGGTNEQCNLLALCGACHEYIHRNRTESYRNGWLVHSWDDPVQVLVFSYREDR